MIKNRDTHYAETIARWVPSKDASILVVGGGPVDQAVLSRCGFKNVTISNLDDRMHAARFLPYEWSYQDAENLTYEDRSFDYVVVHAALHHCYSPHRALLEMYRVARYGAVLFESRDSFIMSVVVKWGLTQTYETIAVHLNDGQYGGVRNSSVPKYVYRWTEREIEKTIDCFEPQTAHQFHYSYAASLPNLPNRIKRAFAARLAVRLLSLPYQVIAFLLPRQQNLFAAFIEKPDIQKTHFDWVVPDGESWRFNQEWADVIFK